MKKVGKDKGDDAIEAACLVFLVGSAFMLVWLGYFVAWLTGEWFHGLGAAGLVLIVVGWRELGKLVAARDRRRRMVEDVRRTRGRTVGDPSEN